MDKNLTSSRLWGRMDAFDYGDLRDLRPMSDFLHREDIMHVIVTGGTGLIGQALARSLVADGHRVTVLSRQPEKKQRLAEEISVVGWDGRSAQGWGDLVNQADAIVNLAGENIASGRWTKERKRRILESRMDAGRAVVEAVQAATSKPSVVIQASAVGYYGPRGDEIVTEDTPPGSDFLAQVCVAWEASTEPVEQFGVRRAIVRTGVVLSTCGGALPRMALPFQFFVGGPVGNGRQYLPWIHIDDEVGAIRFLLEHENASGPFNLTAPSPVTNREFSKTLAKALKRPAWAPVPAFVLRLLFGEMATVLLDGQRAVPKRLQEAGYVFRFVELLPALQDLFTHKK